MSLQDLAPRVLARSFCGTKCFGEVASPIFGDCKKKLSIRMAVSNPGFISILTSVKLRPDLIMKKLTQLHLDSGNDHHKHERQK